MIETFYKIFEIDEEFVTLFLYSSVSKCIDCDQHLSLVERNILKKIVSKPHIIITEPIPDNLIYFLSALSKYAIATPNSMSLSIDKLSFEMRYRYYLEKFLSENCHIDYFYYLEDSQTIKDNFYKEQGEKIKNHLLFFNKRVVVYDTSLNTNISIIEKINSVKNHVDIPLSKVFLPDGTTRERAEIVSYNEITNLCKYYDFSKVRLELLYHFLNGSSVYWKGFRTCDIDTVLFISDTFKCLMDESKKYYRYPNLLNFIKKKCSYIKNIGLKIYILDKFVEISTQVLDDCNAGMIVILCRETPVGFGIELIDDYISKFRNYL